MTQWSQIVKEKIANADFSSIPQAELVAVIKQAIYLQYQFHPRNTQIMALLAYLNHQENKGRLLQVNTGEGKSLIVAMLAIAHALHGKKVDIVTSSTELSIPEAAKQQSFFNMFSLSVGENSNEAVKREVYQRDIVYGTAMNFQGDILRTEFLGENLRGERGFGVVIVDEVDNLLFDNRNLSVQLIGPTPGMYHLEPALATTWNFVNMLASHIIEDNDKTYFIQEDFKIENGKIKILTNVPLEACMYEIADKEAFITEKTTEMLQKALRSLSYDERREWDNIRDLQERIHILTAKLGNTKRKAESSSDKQSYYEDKARRQESEYESLATREKDAKISFSNYRGDIIEIPNHLQEFARHQSHYWIKSAINALKYKKEVHYDVKDGKVMPIDYENTGVIQQNMVWSDGLAQMLQLKEGVPLEAESLSNNFISTPGYFKRYGTNIYGMTGTLGNEPTWNFFKEIFGVDLATIPPYKTRPIYGNEASGYICKELPVKIMSTKEDWASSIVATNLQKLKQGRACLVLCQFIAQAKQLETRFRAQYPQHHKIFTYTGQSAFSKHDIREGELVLATNISGRGTDFKTSEGVEKHGGMHVCLTFLPASYRVELQNVGRTAREGKKGTAQLILHEEDKSKTIEQLRTTRNT